MNDNLTEIVVIVDRSGSMVGIQADSEGGLNNFIKEQKEVEGEANLTLVQFDDVIEFVHDGTPIEEVKEYRLHPRGMTALLDAIGTTITKVGERLRDTPEEERPGRVLVAVITDGYENRSSEYTKDQIFEMINVQEDVWKWDFVFLAANQDAIATGGSLGFKGGKLGNYTADAAGVGATYSGLSCNVTSARLLKSNKMPDFKEDYGKEDDE
jgi:uncharacterized protein YegL